MEKEREGGRDWKSQKTDRPTAMHKPSLDLDSNKSEKKMKFVIQFEI